MNVNVNVQQELEAVFRQVLNKTDLTLERSMTSFDIDGWDSLAHLRIIVEIQQKLAIKLDVGQVIRLRNVGELIDLVEARLPSG